MGIIGGTLTGPLIFILPPLFYTKIIELEKIYIQELKNVESEENLEGMSDTQLLLESSYGTLESNKNYRKSNRFIEMLELCLAKIVDIFYVLHSDCVLSAAVIMFGLCATFTSVYYNLNDLGKVKEFWSPCIQNISLSYLMIDF